MSGKRMKALRREMQTPNKRRYGVSALSGLVPIPVTIPTHPYFVSKEGVPYQLAPGYYLPTGEIHADNARKQYQAAKAAL